MTRRALGLLSALLLAAGSAGAQTVAGPSPVPTPAPGLFGPLPIRLTGEVRERYELPELPLDKAGEVDVRHGVLPFIFSRIRLGLVIEPLPSFSARVELQEARFWGEEQGTLNDPKGVDLHLGYLQLGGVDRFIRLGRRAYSLGEERLFGEDHWYETGRTFDMIRLRSPLFGRRYAGEILYAETTNPLPDNQDEAFELVQLSRLLPRGGYLRVYGVEKHDRHQDPATLDVLGERPGDSIHLALRYLAVDEAAGAWVNSRGETTGRVPDGLAGRSIGWENDVGLARKIFREIDLTIALDGGYLLGDDFARAADYIVQAYAGSVTMTYWFGC